MLVIRDITDRSLLRFQDDFLAEVSHELRTPLTVMFGALELARRALSRKPQARPDDEIIEYVDLSLSMAKQQSRLVNDLLDTARMTGGTFVLSLDDVELVKLVNQSVVAARLLAPDHELQVSLPDKPLFATVDGPRVNQVLMILLGNAIDYSPSGSVISIHLEASNGKASISVSDHGMGIDGEDLTRIFERFGRAGSSHRVHRHGLGLGLHIAREIAVAHGGDISVTSANGTGSTFVLSLPLFPPSGEQAELPSDELAAPAR